MREKAPALALDPMVDNRAAKEERSVTNHLDEYTSLTLLCPVC